MSTPSIVHSTFSIERTYPASPARVFAAFSTPATKRRWFVEGEGWHIDEFKMDFREGGLEISRFRFKDGPPVSNDTVYVDIVKEQRIVFSYVMVVGGKRISASLASIEIFPSGKGTRVVYTEQGQFFDGADQPKMRELGCSELFDKLGEELKLNG
ncbi:SRPBCC family protein [Hyalangium gracile]|uniref:SRPBCC family protein n=1 Tax=Hyalangium gracile TaxID=394092 RepID=UPI001CCE033F|nr:SRPBCC family protein [Hyalangium gracile]